MFKMIEGSYLLRKSKITDELPTNVEYSIFEAEGERNEFEFGFRDFEPG